MCYILKPSLGIYNLSRHRNERKSIKWEGASKPLAGFGYIYICLCTKEVSEKESRETKKRDGRDEPPRWPLETNSEITAVAFQLSPIIFRNELTNCNRELQFPPLIIYFSEIITRSGGIDWNVSSRFPHLGPAVAPRSHRDGGKVVGGGAQVFVFPLFLQQPAPEDAASTFSPSVIGRTRTPLGSLRFEITEGQEPVLNGQFEGREGETRGAQRSNDPSAQPCFLFRIICFPSSDFLFFSGNPSLQQLCFLLISTCQFWAPLHSEYQDCNLPPRTNAGAPTNSTTSWILDSSRPTPAACWCLPVWPWVCECACVLVPSSTLRQSCPALRPRSPLGLTRLTDDVWAESTTRFNFCRRCRQKPPDKVQWWIDVVCCEYSTCFKMPLLFS